MVRDVEGLGIGSHQDFARGVLDLDYQRLAVLVKSRQQLSVDLEGCRAVGGLFLNPGQRECELPHGIPGDGLNFGSPIPSLFRSAQVSSRYSQAYPSLVLHTR